MGICLKIFKTQTIIGNKYTVYRLQNNKPLAVIIILHGMTVNGREDIRLKQFAGMLATLNIICVVPQIEGLACCRFCISDLSSLEDVVQTTYFRYQTKIGLIGFSLGGGYALHVAAKIEIQSMIQFVLCMGAHYSLRDIFRFHSMNHPCMYAISNRASNRQPAQAKCALAVYTCTYS